MDLVAGGMVLEVSNTTNEKYLQLCIQIENILKNPQLKTLHVAYRRPFNSLPSIDDIDWEHGGRQLCDEFQSEISEMYVRNGMKEFDLKPDEEFTLLQLRKYVNSMEKRKRVLDEAFIESASRMFDEEATNKFEDLSKKPIPKTENKQNEFKECYQYDSDIEKIHNFVDGSKHSSEIKKKKQAARERLAIAVCSFGNDYEDGFIYLGIKSDGIVVGLERDKIIGRFPDYDDSFSNHIRDTLETLLHDRTFVISKLQIKFRVYKNKTICIIQVLPSNQPLFFGKMQLFFVRGASPRAEKLSGHDQYRYIRERFPQFK